MKIGWVKGELMLEVHPNPAQADELEASGRFTPARVPEIIYRVATAAGNSVDRVDWEKVKRIARERRGLPVPILRSSIAGNKETASKS